MLRKTQFEFTPSVPRRVCLKTVLLQPHEFVNTLLFLRKVKENFQKGTPEGKGECVAFNDFARPDGSMPMQVESGSPLSQSSSSND
jgi:hypothetical protein